MRRRDIEALIKAIEKGIVKIDKMNKKYPQKYRDEAYMVCDSIITDWYSQYDPIFYNRSGSMYKMFEVKTNGTKLIVDFDGDSLDGLNKYIYDIAFVGGYHGGADKGANHPRPGIPWWRTPIPEFSEWGRPAKKSFSPYNRMMIELDKKMTEIDKERQSEYDAIVNKIKSVFMRF